MDRSGTLILDRDELSGAIESAILKGTLRASDIAVWDRKELGGTRSIKNEPAKIMQIRESRLDGHCVDYFFVPADFRAWLEKSKQWPLRHECLLNNWFGPINSPNFEPKAAVQTEPNRQPYGRRDLQIRAILDVITEMNFNPKRIPEGEKRTIESRCLENINLFSKDGFKRAWQEARNRNLIEVEGIEKYRPSRSGQ
ncbi:hypothetical protein [Methylomagnum sp.]